MRAAPVDPVRVKARWELGNVSSVAGWLRMCRYMLQQEVGKDPPAPFQVLVLSCSFLVPLGHVEVITGRGMRLIIGQN